MSGSVAANYMRKAVAALSSAHLLLQSGDADGACSRAYYAMHDAAHAALLTTGHEMPDAIIKTHHSLIAEFGKKLVLGGQIDAAHGRAFNKMHDMRLLADYSGDPVSLEHASSAVKQAEAFVAAIRARLDA